MTKEEKQLLIKDLSARLPYDVNVYCEWNYLDGERGNDSGILLDIDLLKDTILFKRSSGNCTIIPFNRIDGVVKPYLRPMFKITNEEFQFLHENIPYDFTRIYSNEFNLFDDIHLGNTISIDDVAFLLDTLNKWHLDYRGLIKMGLALPAPEEMYKTN